MRAAALIALALAVGAPPAAFAADPAGCTEVAGILEDAVEKWPDLLSTQRVKPRLAAVQIATTAGIAVNYAIDGGWTQAEQAPIIALRDTRELSMDDPTYSKANAPGLLHGYLGQIAAVLAGKCPTTAAPDISGLSTDYPES
ncbi:hypothetical protein [Sinisalibacter aestuarii]|uniref:Uncharacterized protein n=1 Tax=Sinisalibacter aestuarii TaxID=2949426 RepID=A0ABQ5LQU5_9RHOB|nr:hypothetical protein [Sinisalibacter aestuarii]GKY87361.1 hypothetical protein STA1M1_12300 [Sinisalibacter aestuarii]